jgi:hypothetical protein
VLTATASATVTGTSTAIEIFDQTTGAVAAACMASSQCAVGYSAQSGIHTFAAFITSPTSRLPIDGPTIASNRLSVGWVGVTLSSDSAVVAPGRPITFAATSTVDVGRLGYDLEIYDSTARNRIAYCGHGTYCSTVLTHPQGGIHSLIAFVSEPSNTLPPRLPAARSKPVAATWLKVTITASTIYPHAGGTVYLSATSNADLTKTPWSLGIADARGWLLSAPCKSGRSCTAQVSLTGGSAPWFSAMIGVLPPVNPSPLNQVLHQVLRPLTLVDVQARSASVQPTRVIWGVDSCKSLTDLPTGADGQNLYVINDLGYPDFWGRYLTNTVCPAISSVEIAAAVHWHMGILPIYNDYDCSAVVGYTAGSAYAAAASAAAAGLHIPAGRGLAVDIEPPGAYCPGAGNVDAGFIDGWFDGITAAGYAPVYYGNGTAGSEFGTAWCTAVSQRPEIAAFSYLWSFEPSLSMNRMRLNAPAFSPYQPGCTANVAAWQYTLSAGSDPDVDVDEALSTLPIWFP